MRHAPRQRTLTTIGLPARKDQLLRSMLLAANAHTTDQWQFRDELEADVAICDPHSMLAGVALSRSRREGRPSCVWLTQGDEPAPEGRRLQDPLVTVRLIALLDSLSDALPARRDVPGPPAPAGTIVGGATAEPGRRYDALLLMRDLLDRGTADPFHLRVRGLELHVVPGTRTVRLSEPLSDETVACLLNPGPMPRLEPLVNGQAIPAGHVTAIDAVLWTAGLAGGMEEPLPTLPPEGVFSLKRWPDFGRLPPRAGHMQMAAALIRRPHTIPALARATRLAVTEARAFVTACSLCGLIDAELAPVVRQPAAIVETARPARPARPALGGLFTSIRLALGMGR